MLKTEQQSLYELALFSLEGIGAVTAKTLISYLGGIEQVFKATRSELMKVPGIGEKRVEEIISQESVKRAESLLVKLQKYDIGYHFYLDKNFPRRLLQIDSCPIVLFVQGDLDLNRSRMISIVGTRSPSQRGALFCEQLIDQLAGMDVCILSGLAYGIDTIAHKKALELEIPTVGVLGSGMDRIYPSSNRDLALKMSKGGAVLTEFAFGVKPDRENFPKRNRIIAAMCDALIVIESARKGGSIITAEYANEFSKDVFAVPGRVSDVMSEGCNLLIKGHKAHMLESVKDLEYILRWDKRPVQKQLHFPDMLSKDEKEIYEAIADKNEIALDQLVYGSKMSLSRLSSILLNLEIRGLVKCKPGRKYILASRSRVY